VFNFIEATRSCLLGFKKRRRNRKKLQNFGGSPPILLFTSIPILAKFKLVRPPLSIIPVISLMRGTCLGAVSDIHAWISSIMSSAVLRAPASLTSYKNVCTWNFTMVLKMDVQSFSIAAHALQLITAAHS
jgi:hypothetical protein